MMQTMQQKSNNEHSGNAEQFAWVFVSESPVTKTPQRGNLTGNPRLLRDSAANIHASIQRWNSLHLHGISLLKAIGRSKVDEKYREDLQSLCDDLEKDCDGLDEVVQNLELSAHQMKTIGSLYGLPNNLFLTWPVQKFGKIARQIYEAYRAEARIKRKVLENVAHDHRESWKMLHLATWVHQARISENLTTILESLLIETGHR